MKPTKTSPDYRVANKELLPRSVSIKVTKAWYLSTTIWNAIFLIIGDVVITGVTFYNTGDFTSTSILVFLSAIFAIFTRVAKKNEPIKKGW